MQTVTKDEFYIHYEEYAEKVLGGAIFIYPTDTIYGIGCNAMDDRSVAKIREIKGRNKLPFSVIVPSVEWIQENCEIDDKVAEWLNELPGPTTLILNLKNKEAVSKEVLGEGGTIGVRIPKHWIRGFVRQMGVPVVTTSVNESGKKPMMSPEEIDMNIKPKIHFLVDEGVLDSAPSKIVRLVGEKPEVNIRKKK